MSIIMEILPLVTATAADANIMPNVPSRDYLDPQED